MDKIKRVYFSHADMTVTVQYENWKCVYPFFDIETMNDFIKKCKIGVRK